MGTKFDTQSISVIAPEAHTRCTSRILFSTFLSINHLSEATAAFITWSGFNVSAESLRITCLGFLERGRGILKETLKAETHPPAISSFFTLQTFSSYNLPASVISPPACLVFIFIYGCISLVSSSPMNTMSTNMMFVDMMNMMNTMFSKYGHKLHHISSSFRTEKYP